MSKDDSSQNWDKLWAEYNKSLKTWLQAFESLQKAAYAFENPFWRKAIEDLSFSLPRGGIVGVIGPNGAGKTTLFRMITGAEKPESGELRVGSTVQLAYVDQSRETLDPSKTVYEEITGAEIALVPVEEFGDSVALSGSTVAVGAPVADINGSSAVGAGAAASSDSSPWFALLRTLCGQLR